jgi:hypothetical protein
MGYKLALAETEALLGEAEAATLRASATRVTGAGRSDRAATESAAALHEPD